MTVCLRRGTALSYNFLKRMDTLSYEVPHRDLEVKKRCHTFDSCLGGRGMSTSSQECRSLYSQHTVIRHHPFPTIIGFTIILLTLRRGRISSDYFRLFLTSSSLPSASRLSRSCSKRCWELQRSSKARAGRVSYQRRSVT